MRLSLNTFEAIYGDLQVFTYLPHTYTLPVQIGLKVSLTGWLVHY